jgi:glucose/arabinose dehydrogenase
LVQRSNFFTGLDSPWDLAFTPDGAAFFSEKCRGLSVRRADGKVIRLFGTEGSALRARDLVCVGQSGMQGVTIDPDFARNRRLYVFMSSSLGGPPRTNRVIRLVVNQEYTRVSQRRDIITDIPFKHEGNRWGGPGAHSGGRLRFGPDGLLYVTTGDNHNGSLPQDLRRLGGKVLRVDRNGKAAPGNKTPAGGDKRIFTYGHRNVQGISFHPTTGQAFIAEHGPGHSDEVTALVAGGNGGWDPKPAPGVSCADNYCGYISNRLDGTPTRMTDLEKFPDAMRPTLVNRDSQGMGPCLFLRGEKWKDWQGTLLVGVMAGPRVEVVHLNPEGDFVKKSVADLPRARMRSLVQGPNQDLFVVTDEGSIWRVTPR